MIAFSDSYSPTKPFAKYYSELGYTSNLEKS